MENSEAFDHSGSGLIDGERLAAGVGDGDAVALRLSRGYHPEVLWARRGDGPQRVGDGDRAAAVIAASPELREVTLGAR